MTRADVADAIVAAALEGLFAAAARERNHSRRAETLTAIRALTRERSAIEAVIADALDPIEPVTPDEDAPIPFRLTARALESAAGEKDGPA